MKKLFCSIVWALFFGPFIRSGFGVETDKQAVEDYFVDEYATIIKAAERNDCRGDDFLILLAIRKAENGGHGREFGILHPVAQRLILKAPEKSLEIQAAWCAATIVKNHRRWNGKRDYIDFLAGRYCPKEIDPEGHKHWLVNVKFFYKRFKVEQEAIEQKEKKGG